MYIYAKRVFRMAFMGRIYAHVLLFVEFTRVVLAHSKQK
jgi:hypothetical protein